jgi:hypothetical protein
MTRHRIYNSPEEAKQGNLNRAIIRMKRLYEDPEYRQKCINIAKRVYQEKKQQLLEFKNMKAQLQAYQNQSMMID